MTSAAGFPPPGRYTVQATVKGADLIATLYARSADIYIGGVTITCTSLTSAYACVGQPYLATVNSSVDSTRSGNIDTSAYNPPLKIPVGSAYSILWIGAAASTASMSVTVVAGP